METIEALTTAAAAANTAIALSRPRSSHALSKPASTRRAAWDASR